MLNFDEELKKFKPCLEIEDIEEAVHQEDLTDMMDIVREANRTEQKHVYHPRGTSL